MKRNQKMKRSMRALMAPIVLCMLFAAENASASWIRYLLLEYPNDSTRPMEVVEQAWGGGGPWTADDPRIWVFFDEYGLSPVISNQTPSSVTIDISLFNTPGDPSQGPGVADVGAYNFFAQGTNVLTATLEVSQSMERVTIAYLSSLGGAALTPLPGGTSIDGVTRFAGVNDPFGSIPVCSDGCATALNANVFPLYVEVARVPEPAVIPLLGGALFAAMAVGQFSMRRSVRSPLPRM